VPAMPGSSCLPVRRTSSNFDAAMLEAAYDCPVSTSSSMNCGNYGAAGGGGVVRARSPLPCYAGRNSQDLLSKCLAIQVSWTPSFYSYIFIFTLDLQMTVLI
jgi:hypothetical protein